MAGTKLGAKKAQKTLAKNRKTLATGRRKTIAKKMTRTARKAA